MSIWQDVEYNAEVARSFADALDSLADRVALASDTGHTGHRTTRAVSQR